MTVDITIGLGTTVLCNAILIGTTIFGICFNWTWFWTWYIVIVHFTTVSNIVFGLIVMSATITTKTSTTIIASGVRGRITVHTI